MRILAAACAFAILPPMAAAEPVQMPFKAEAGAVWKIERKQTITVTQFGRTSEKAAGITATLKVLEASGAGFLMEWTTDTVTGDATAIDGMAPDLFTGVAVRFRTDTAGAPVELMDPEAVVAGALQGMQRHGVSQGSPALSGARKTILELAPAVQAAYVLTDAAQIAACQGLALEAGKPLKRTAVSPKFGNSPTVDLLVTATLEKAGSAKTPARIRIVETTDQQAMKKAFAEVVQARQKPGDPPVDVDALAASVSRTTTRDCSVDRQKGNALAVTVETVVGIDERQVRDVHAISIARAQ